LLTHEGVDLLKKMWEYVPEKRISAIEALKHPFFNDLKTEN
jgi:serine/threonine protein kinase